MADDRFYNAARRVVQPILKRGFDWVVRGDEHIPASGGVLLAANHISYFDGLCLAYVADRRGRRTKFLVKASFFDVPGVGWILRGVGDIPVGVRRHGDRSSALDAAVEALRAGWCVGVFPEGRISPDLEPGEPRTGVARMAAAAGVPVLPVGLWGSHRVWTPRRWPRPRRVAEAVAVGEPLSVEDDDDPVVAADRIMTAICGQVGEARRLYPERPPAGRAAWWYRSPDTARLRPCQGDSF